MPTSSGFQVNEVLTSNNTNKYLLRSGRNVLINGAMAIAQRATSIASIITGGYYTVDRWLMQISSAGTWTQAQTTVAGSEAPAADGFRNSARLTCTTANASPAAGSFFTFTQSIEGQMLQQFAKGNTSAKTFALSFWVRSNRTGTYVAELVDSGNARTVSATYTISASDVWQKVRIIFPADTSGVFANVTTAAMQLNFWLVAGTNYTSATLQTVWGNDATNNRATGQVNVAATINNYWQITGTQLEPDSVCTPYETRLINEELLMCQRYFFKTYDQSQPLNTNDVSGAIFISTSTDTFGGLGVEYSFPVEMRAIPTIAFRRADGSSTLWDTNNRGTTGTLQPAIAYANRRAGYISVATGIGNYAGFYTYGHFSGSAEI